MFAFNQANTGIFSPIMSPQDLKFAGNTFSPTDETIIRDLSHTRKLKMRIDYDEGGNFAMAKKDAFQHIEADEYAVFDNCRKLENSDESEGVLLAADGTCPKIRNLLAGSEVPVLWLGGNHDPLATLNQLITEKRAEGSPIHTLHWVSHGEPGTLLVGQHQVNISSLLSNQEHLGSWQLKTIALWSCFAGADRDFIAVLEELTGATVWSSEQAIGRLKGGSNNWQLDHPRLDHSPALPIHTADQLDWGYQLSSNTHYQPRNRFAFAAIKADGSVVTWGNKQNGGDSSSVKTNLNKVKQIFSSTYAFAALREDGSVVTWGNENGWGKSKDNLNGVTSVKNIFATNDAFAALTDQGSVVTWGDYEYGGDPDNGEDSDDIKNSLIDVEKIFSTSGAFAALKKDGSVVTWGAYVNDPGEDQHDLGGKPAQDIRAQLNSNVKDIYSNVHAFAALKDGGEVVTWGDSVKGGTPVVFNNGRGNPVSGLEQGVKKIYSTSEAFAALKEDGSVVTWGKAIYGGDSSNVSIRPDENSGVKEIYSNGGAFVALTNDGSIITWGHDEFGGNDRAVSKLIESKLEDDDKINQIFSTYKAFAALTTKGKVISWGVKQEQPKTVNNTNIYATYSAFADSVSEQLKTVNVTNIYTTTSAFAALTGEGKVITWGGAILWWQFKFS